MIGFEYEGSVNYISRIDDFQEYMKPEVYEAMREAFENGCDGVGGFRKKYEEIKTDRERMRENERRGGITFEVIRNSDNKKFTVYDIVRTSHYTYFMIYDGGWKYIDADLFRECDKN